MLLKYKMWEEKSSRFTFYKIFVIIILKKKKEENFMDSIAIGKMRKLVRTLNTATEKYDAGDPQMSDIEWDNLYSQLKRLERETNTVFKDSPTNIIHYKAVNSLEKVKHNHPMLSLDKTKNTQKIRQFLGDKDFICMGKMDGLTLSLHYKDGVLISAETRGNGVIGEQVLHNALTVWNIPKAIQGISNDLVIDGEIICTYKDFETFSTNYKNPRNFASGSIRLLDANECKKRKLSFVAWDAVEGLETSYLLSDKLDILKQLGFDVVPYLCGNNERKSAFTVDQCAEYLFEQCELIAYPVDGLVFKFNDCKYYESQGRTEHHFKGGIAFKRYDEEIETTITDIEWQLGRSGVLTPVAIFEPVDLLGTIVSRASLHNISVMQSLYPDSWFKGLGVTVFKANEIIPQINSAFKRKDSNTSHKLQPPKKCPYCGESTQKKNNDGIITLYCTNPQCGDRVVAQIEHFCSKKGMDIKGLSKATLTKLYQVNWINSIEDIFVLHTHKKEWVNLPGFGEKSVNNILDAIEASRNCDLIKFITALGIPLIGKTVATDIVKMFPTYKEFRDAVDNKFDFSTLPNFAESKTNAILNFDYTIADRVFSYLNIVSELKEETVEEEQKLKNITICITGKLNTMRRVDFIAKIESMGGKVVGSITKKVTYLVTNDPNSGTVKNQKAKELGIEIISEKEFIKKFDF